MPLLREIGQAREGAHTISKRFERSRPANGRHGKRPCKWQISIVWPKKNCSTVFLHVDKVEEPSMYVHELTMRRITDELTLALLFNSGNRTGFDGGAGSQCCPASSSGKGSIQTKEVERA